MAMTDDIVARAQADLQRAELAADRAREALARAEAEVTDLGAFLRMFGRYVSEPTTLKVGEHAVNVRQPARTSGRGKEMVDKAIELIQERGEPVMIGDLTDHVLAAGFVLGGQDQKSNLAGYLSRDPRVRSYGRNVGWDLVELEEAASEPGSEKAAPSQDIGGTDGGPTLAFPGDDDPFG